jgi:hypothetical protein
MTIGFWLIAARSHKNFVIILTNYLFRSEEIKSCLHELYGLSWFVMVLVIRMVLMWVQDFRDWAGRSGFWVRLMADRVRAIASFYGLDGGDCLGFYALR